MTWRRYTPCLRTYAGTGFGSSANRNIRCLIPYSKMILTRDCSTYRYLGCFAETLTASAGWALPWEMDYGTNTLMTRERCAAGARSLGYEYYGLAGVSGRLCFEAMRRCDDMTGLDRNIGRPANVLLQCMVYSCPGSGGLVGLAREGCKPWTERTWTLEGSAGAGERLATPWTDLTVPSLRSAQLCM